MSTAPEPTTAGAAPMTTAPAPMTAVPPPLVAEVVRSGFVECRHRGHIVVTAPGGEVLLAVGDVDTPMLPRSAAKPLQAVASLQAGADLAPEMIALACSSHSGEPYHLEVVRQILASAGLGVEALCNTPAWPVDDAERERLIAAGAHRTALTQNCSGKHAAFLSACVANGWDLAGYLDPDHPVQRVVRQVTEDLAGEPVAATVVDGCGAPQLATSLAGLARSFGRLATAPSGTSENRVAAAMRAHPFAVGGTGRDVTVLMEQLPGLVVKDGAEGVFAGALVDGTGVAVKIDDGGGRARTPVFVAALRAAGLTAPVLDRLATVPVLGHGRPVGVVRSVTFADA